MESIIGKLPLADTFSRNAKNTFSVNLVIGPFS
jgi:hypothetical protein